MGQHKVAPKVVKSLEQASIEADPVYVGVGLEVGSNPLERAWCSTARHARTCEVQNHVKPMLIEGPRADLDASSVPVQRSPNGPKPGEQRGDEMKATCCGNEREVAQPFFFLWVEDVGQPTLGFGSDGRLGLLSIHLNQRVLVHAAGTSSRSLNA
jgi:hypothetical protein